MLFRQWASGPVSIPALGPVNNQFASANAGQATPVAVPEGFSPEGVLARQELVPGAFDGISGRAMSSLIHVGRVRCADTFSDMLSGIFCLA